MPRVVGSVQARPESELLPPLGPIVQPAHVTALAVASAAAGLDAVHIDQSASSADALVLAQLALGAAPSLPVGVAAAGQDATALGRAAATVALLHPGRVGVRVRITGAAQAAFALELDRLWRGADPAGGHWSAVRPSPAPFLDVQLGADSSFDRALAAVVSCCYLPAGPPAALAARIGRLREYAAGRSLSFGVAIRPLVAEHAAAAAELSRRLLRVAPPLPLCENDALALLTRADGVPAFAGTVEDLAARLAEYHRAGVGTFHLRGFDPVTDVATFGAVAARLRASTRDEQNPDEKRSHDVHRTAVA